MCCSSVCCFLPNVFAQGSTRFRLPHGATARLGKGWIKDLQFSPNGAQLAVATTIGIWIYDVTTGEERNLLRGVMGGANAITYSPDGRILAAAHEDRTVYLWDNVAGSKHAFVGAYRGYPRYRFFKGWWAGRQWGKR